MPLVSATIRDGECLPYETCLFSMFKQDNTHVGRCGYYNYSVCYIGSRNVSLIEGFCPSEFLLGFYTPNNTHVSAVEGYYNYSLCISGLDCSFKASSNCSEDPIISLYKQNNTHVGSGGYYNYSICCPRISRFTGRAGGPGKLSGFNETSVCFIVYGFLLNHTSSRGVIYTTSELLDFKEHLEDMTGEMISLDTVESYILNFELHCSEWIAEPLALAPDLKEEIEEEGGFFLFILLVFSVFLVFLFVRRKKIIKKLREIYGKDKKKKKKQKKKEKKTEGEKDEEKEKKKEGKKETDFRYRQP